MLSLQLTALEEGYAVSFQPAASLVDIEGGLPHTRLDTLDPDYTVSVSWLLDNVKMPAFDAFYRNISYSGDSFLASLLVEDFSIRSYECQFIPGSVAMTEVSSQQRIVTATLAVAPSGAYTMADDNAVMDLYEEYGEEGSQVLDLLAILVNEDLPE